MCQVVFMKSPVAVPPIEGPFASHLGVAETTDREAGPLRSRVITPRGSALEQCDRAVGEVDLVADQSLGSGRQIGVELVYPFAHPKQVTFWDHAPMVSSLNPLQPRPGTHRWLGPATRVPREPVLWPNQRGYCLPTPRWDALVHFPALITLQDHLPVRIGDVYPGGVQGLLDPQAQLAFGPPLQGRLGLGPHPYEDAGFA